MHFTRISQYITFFSAALLIATLPATAQSTAGDRNSNDDTIQVTFECLIWEQPVKGIKYESRGEVVDIAFRPRRRSQTHDYYGPNPIRFFTEYQDAEGMTQRRYIATVQIPEKFSNAVLFVENPSENEHNDFRILAFDDDPASFQLGTYRIFNLTRSPVRMAFGEKTLELGPQQTNFLKPEKKLGETFGVRFWQQNEANEWEMALSNTFVYRDRARIMIFLTPPADSRWRMSARVFPEYNPSPGK